ncbi:MAG: serine/threonine protein kinase [Anaerolineae bacterium]|nr:serine/threonine protein kinase [Anaerolineae bacterium]
MSNLIGRTLGTYEILDEIGHGGMANVYLATQPSIGREVAIKVLPPHFMQDRTFVKRFTREVQVIAKLQHPHILPVHDFGEQDGLPYIVMTYMTGGTLSDLIYGDQPLPLTEVVRLVDQIASGLDHAHQKGIIHRDFKPSNVLLDEHNNVYLADFGIAKATESTTQITGSGIVGTPAYMAPEVAQSATVTPLVDIYALGVTVYEMLVGRHPYQGETPVGILMSHVAEPIPDVRHHRPDLPEAVQHVIDRAMAKDPAVRYQTAKALAADLRAVLLDDSPLTEATPMPVGSGLKSTVRIATTDSAADAPTSRRTMMVMAIMAVVAVLVGLIALGVPSIIAQTFAGQLPTDDTSSAPSSDRILTGHSGAVTSVALSPDGKILASGSLDKTVILWDLQTDEPIYTLETPDEVHSMAFYPDGTVLLVGGRNGYTTHWSPQTGQQVSEGHYALPPESISVAISPDQTAYTFAAREFSIPVLDPLTYEWLKAVEYPSSVWVVTYSPDGTVIAAGLDNGAIILRDSKTDEEIDVLEGHTEGINSLAFSPDGNMLASASKDKTVILWDTETGEILHTLARHTDVVNSVAWSPNSDILASASLDGTIILWDPATGGLVDTVIEKDNPIHSVVFDVNGALLVSGMQDGTVFFWKID